MAMPASCLAQSVSNQPPAELELHLEAGNLQSGIPDGFTITLTNISNYDILLPTPPVRCEDPTLDGNLFLHDNFKPLDPNESPQVWNCTNERMDMRSIFERIKDWKTLHPGESLNVSATRKRFLDLNNSAGSYEFWVDYHPPAMSPEDRRALILTGIKFSHFDLTSNHVTFVRAN
jgi:hypothetical protein